MNDLPGRRSGHILIGDKAHPAGAFEACKTIAAPLPNVGFAEVFAFMQHHDCVHALTPFFMRHADDSHVFDRRVAADCGFDFGRIHILRAFH